MLQDIQSIATGLGLGAIALLTVLYVFYEKILVLLAWLLHAAFAVGLTLSTSSILVEPVYQVLAVHTVENTGIPAQLREGDDFVRRVQAMPDRILERVKHPFASATPELPDLGPLGAVQPAPTPGALESNILPLLQRFARVCLRLTAFALGVGLMCFGLVSRSRVDTVLADRALRQRVEMLEARLAAQLS